MKNCNLCPNACNADRTASAGVCGVTDEIRIAKYYPHMYEEPVISGDRGSGAVFFCGCSLQCAFCQNYEVSRARRGKIITAKELADIFRKLEDMGVHNVNLVTGTHYADRIAEALDLYRPKIPVVWNTHGYETAETLELIDPYIDIYLPDLKFYGRETAASVMPCVASVCAPTACPSMCTSQSVDLPEAISVLSAHVAVHMMLLRAS